MKSRAKDKSKYAAWIDPHEVKPYEKNAKIYDKKQVKNIVNSIRRFGWQQDVVITSDKVLVIGHGRRLAALELGCEMPYHMIDKTADELTDADIRELRIADNQTNAETGLDFDILNGEIMDLDFEGFDFDFGQPQEKEEAEDEYQIVPLADRFIVPPFSVLDTRQGYWQTRRREWLKLTGDLSETRDGEFGRITSSELVTAINGGTSNFDPVLAEVMYKWFNIPGGTILDPFGGEQTKGVVAGECGYKYSAVEIRQDQVDVNNRATAKYENVKYTCGNSNDISELIPERGFDMCFTSPPYYDLEVYSKEDMSALGTYEEFMEQYKNIFQQCYDMLAEDAFCVVKVGEIRNKKTGIYRNFVGDTVTTLIGCGFKYYNEIILVNSVGTLPLRAGQTMRTRKVGKVHQIVLVFYKGNPDNINKKYPELTFDDAAESEGTESSGFEVEEYECSLK